MSTPKTKSLKEREKRLRNTLSQVGRGSGVKQMQRIQIPANAEPRSLLHANIDQSNLLK